MYTENWKIYPRTEGEDLRKDQLGRGCPPPRTGRVSVVAGKGMYVVTRWWGSFWIAQARAGETAGKPGSSF